MGMLFCTNNNSFAHEDSFDGKHFVFEPGMKVPLTIEAAEHMFGFRQMDKTSTLHRLGWNMKFDPVSKTFADDPDALTKLSKFIFTEAVMTEAPAKEQEAPAQLLPTKPPLSLKKGA